MYTLVIHWQIFRFSGGQNELGSECRRKGFPEHSLSIRNEAALPSSTRFNCLIKANAMCFDGADIWFAIFGLF